MEVILLEKMRNLGNLGDTVMVKPGYGRNYLLPTGKAVRATKRNIEHFELRRAELEAKAKAQLDAANAKATEIMQMPAVTITAMASDEGRLFGSVGAREIVEMIHARGIEVNKSDVDLPMGTIRQTGEHEVNIHLHTDVTVTISVQVIAEA